MYIWILRWKVPIQAQNPVELYEIKPLKFTAYKSHFNRRRKNFGYIYFLHWKQHCSIMRQCCCGWCQKCKLICNSITAVYYQQHKSQPNKKSKLTNYNLLFRSQIVLRSNTHTHTHQKKGVLISFHQAGSHSNNKFAPSGCWDDRIPQTNHCRITPASAPPCEEVIHWY